jgi:hypothetical protein
LGPGGALDVLQRRAAQIKGCTCHQPIRVSTGQLFFRRYEPDQVQRVWIAISAPARNS